MALLKLNVPPNSHRERTIFAALRVAPLPAQMPSGYGDEAGDERRIGRRLLAHGR